MEKDENSKKIEIPMQKAIALSYKKTEIAPKVVAKGQGYVAQRIIDRGKSENITVVEDKSLIEELTKIDLGLHIPPELYEVVAQLLIFISDLDKMESYRKENEK